MEQVDLQKVLKRMRATNRALEGVPGSLAQLCQYGAADFEQVKKDFPTSR